MSAVKVALLQMRTAFPQREVPVETVALYARQLADLDEVAVIDAIERLIRTSRFFPTIAEIREAAVAGGATEGLAELAWAEVTREARRVGWNPTGRRYGGVRHEPEKPVFTSAITVAAVESLTWKLICHGEQAEIRDQFLWTWKNLATGMVKRGAAADGGVVMLPGVETALKRIG
jgi:hypothetical protein